MGSGQSRGSGTASLTRNTFARPRSTGAPMTGYPRNAAEQGLTIRRWVGLKLILDKTFEDLEGLKGGRGKRHENAGFRWNLATNHEGGTSLSGGIRCQWDQASTGWIPESDRWIPHPLHQSSRRRMLA